MLFVSFLSLFSVLPKSAVFSNAITSGSNPRDPYLRLRRTARRGWPGVSLLDVFTAFLFASCCCLATAQTPTPVLTQGNDLSRDKLNETETILTPANVNPATFGKLFTLPVDGFVYAQPLYVPNVSIPSQGTHNVVYVATADDSVYAFDADGQSTQPLWHTSFINPAAGITTEPLDDNPNNSDLDSQIGIMSTPVIDSSAGTLFVVAKTDEASGGITTPCFRLHALDITTGAERTGSPTACIQASVTGTGTPNDGSGHVTFSALYQLQRPGLALSGGSVYVAFGAWSDTAPYHGWIVTFAANTLQQTAAFNSTPNGSEGSAGVWMSGSGLAIDTSGNLYFPTGNGNFDGASNFGDSYLKLSSSLALLDYFTPYNQKPLDDGDLDVASGGVLLLPDSAGTATHPHIMIGCGKNGAIYVIDRDNLGQYNSSNDNQIIQELLNVIGSTTVDPKSSTNVENCYSTGAYWQGRVYFGGIGDALKEFTFSNGLLSTTVTSQSATIYQFPGTIPVVSANGSTNGIVWAIENSGDVTGNGTASTAVLHAYDATNLGNELYNSSEVAADNAGAPVKFAVPTVTNGKVYVGTQSSVAVYGLLSSTPQAAAPTFSPGAGNYSGSISVAISDASAGTTIYYTTDGTTPTTSSNVYTGPILLSRSATVIAIAAGNGYSSSSEASSTYIINDVAPITYAQVASATPQSPTTTVNVTYPSQQGTGDMNIVVVGWNDTTANVQSVTDTAGNTYRLAIGPTSGTGIRQSIYYAPGIVGGSNNSVTVTFDQPAAYPDIRVLEYSGVTTLDATAGASGSGTAASSGAAAIHSNSELIFGADTISTTTTSAGSGFTARIITSPDSDMAEDENATSTGTYSATANLTSGNWVMQMATFSTAASPCPNPNPNANPVSFATPGDFNSDCRSDILWRDSTTGEVYMWFMNGTSIVSQGSPYTVGSNWVMQGVGDFDGDGKADILWRDRNTGEVYIWFMNGTSIVSQGSPDTVGSNWVIQGVGDFDGDGRSDILWRDSTTGEVYIWFMNGTSIVSQGSPDTVGSNWVIQGVGDFDGDGKADILWRDSTTGEVYIWFMNGTSITSQGSPNTVGFNWVIQGVGDFNGDGRSDILWRESTTGEVYIWFMNGTSIVSQGSPYTVGSDWIIQGVGDFDGDGKGDILWRNTTGEVYIWFMNGTSIVSQGSPNTVGSNWQIFPISYP